MNELTTKLTLLCIKNPSTNFLRHTFIASNQTEGSSAQPKTGSGSEEELSRRAHGRVRFGVLGDLMRRFAIGWAVAFLVRLLAQSQLYGSAAMVPHLRQVALN